MREVVELDKLLKSLEEAIKDPERILTKDVTNSLTNTREREALSLFLIAAAMNKSYEDKGDKTTFEVCRNDSDDRLDGYLRVTDPKGEKQDLEFEQTMLTKEQFKTEELPGGDISHLVIEKIEEKHSKKYDAVDEVILVILMDLKGHTIPRKVKEYLVKNFKFAFYIQVALDERVHKDGVYRYVLMDLNPFRKGNSRLQVSIARDFRSYDVQFFTDEEKNIP